MAKQLRQVIRACKHCLQYEGGTPKTPLCPIVTTTPLDLLHVDFTSIETITKFLYEGYISIFGALARLLRDRGTSFTSSIIEELCKILDIK